MHSYIQERGRGLLTSSMNGGGGGNGSFPEYRHSPAYMDIFPCMAVKRINFQRNENDVNLKFSKQHCIVMIISTPLINSQVHIQSPSQTQALGLADLCDSGGQMANFTNGLVDFEGLKLIILEVHIIFWTFILIPVQMNPYSKCLYLQLPISLENILKTTAITAFSYNCEGANCVR